MIPQVLQTLKERIAQDSSLSPERKAELQDLVSELEEGLGTLSEEQQGAMYREVEAKKASGALRQMENSATPKLENLSSLEGLGGLLHEEERKHLNDGAESSANAPVSSDENGARAAEAHDPPVAGFVRQINESLLRFETAHPTLTATTNRLADMLASVGI